MEAPAVLASAWPLVRRLIELQSGQVLIESKVGQGTTVSFILPFGVPTMSRHIVEVG